MGRLSRTKFNMYGWQSIVIELRTGWRGHDTNLFISQYIRHAQNQNFIWSIWLLFVVTYYTLFLSYFLLLFWISLTINQNEIMNSIRIKLTVASIDEMMRCRYLFTLTNKKFNSRRSNNVFIDDSCTMSSSVPMCCSSNGELLVE